MTDMALDNASGGASASPAAGSSPTAPVSAVPSGAAPTSGAGQTITPEPEGPIPVDRHKAILENARREYESKYGWVGERQREQVEDMERWYRQMDADPVAFHEWLGARLRAMPEYAPRLSGGRPADSSAAPPGLQPDGVMPDGTPVITLPNVQRVIDQLLTQRLGPIQQRFTQQEVEQQVRASAEADLADARANWHAFPDLERDIKQIMQRDRRATLHSAYQRAYKEYLPKFEQKIRSQQVTDLATKAHASTVAPGGGASLTPKDRDALSWEDVLKQKAARS